MTPSSVRRVRWVTAGSVVLLAAVVLVVVLVVNRGADSAAVPPSGSPVPSGTTTATPGPTASATGGATPAASPVASMPGWASGLNVLPPVAFDHPGDFRTGVVATLVSVTSVDGVGRLPGEKSGPAVAVTVRIDNGSSAPITLDNVVVDAYDADDSPLSPLSQDPHAKPFSGKLAPGANATGTYVLSLSSAHSSALSITVSYDGGTPAVAFQGTVTS